MGNPAKETYEQIGRQMAEALSLFLGALAQQVHQSPVAADPEPVQPLRARLDALEERLKRLEDRLLSQPGAPLPEAGGEGPGAAGARQGRPAKARKAPRRRRMPKEEVRARALEAGRQLAAQGKLVNLTTVANAAGLNYGQVTYAFQRKENLLRELGLLEPAPES